MVLATIFPASLVGAASANIGTIIFNGAYLFSLEEMESVFAGYLCKN
jgi:hypothetical protein